MTDEAVLSGTYSDFKLVKTRGVIQIVIEMPLEYAQKATDLLGFPNPSEEVHVALARLQAPEREIVGSTYNPKTGEIGNVYADEAKPKSYAQEAGILSNDKAFWRFIHLYDASDPNRDHSTDAAEYIREKCDVSSRRELLEGTPEGQAFRDLKAEFEAWKAVG